MLRKMIEENQLENRRAYQRYILEDSASLFTVDGKEEILLLNNLSGAGACVCGSYSFRMNEFVVVTVKAVSPIFRGLFGKRVRVAWSKQIKPNFWEAGLDFRSNI
jgi:hypothetical protein